MSARFGVRGYPTLVVLDAGGRESRRIVGYREAAALAAELGAR